jgi:hypothetical protein
VRRSLGSLFADEAPARATVAPRQVPPEAKGPTAAIALPRNETTASAVISALRQLEALNQEFEAISRLMQPLGRLWRCQMCTLENVAGVDQCAACGLSGAWCCVTCEAENRAWALECARCKQPLAAQSAGAERPSK